MKSYSMGTEEHHDVPQLFVTLVYTRGNLLGAKLYVDPSNRFFVKIEHAPSLQGPSIMVIF